MWYNVLLFDIIRPKKCLSPVFSLFLKSFCSVPTYFKICKKSRGEPKFDEKGGSSMVIDFDKKKIVNIHINLSIH